MSKNLKYIDLFAGCGGLSLGLHNSGWKGIFAIEKGIDAFATLKHNLIDNINHFDWPEEIPIISHDVNTFLGKYEELLYKIAGKVDLVAGGPPCQGFSMAGRRKENDIRNDLVNSYIKFISIVKPKLIFFENVKGFTLEFKKHKATGIQYSQLVLDALDELGYNVKGEIVDFSDFGVPQRRKRFILIGIKKEIDDSKKLNNFFEDLKKSSINFCKKKSIEPKTVLSDAISDLLKDNGQIECEGMKNFKSGIYGDGLTAYQKYMRFGSKEVYPDSHRFANHSPEIINKFDEILKGTVKNKSITSEIRTKYNIKKHRVVPLDCNDISPTLTTLPDDIIHYCEPRILTVREYARLQTFPDWFQFKGKYTTGGKRRVVEVPRYTQVGNAIPPLFSEQCGELLKKLIK